MIEAIMSNANYITSFGVERYNYKNTRHHDCSSGYPFVGIGVLIDGSAVFTAQSGIKIEVHVGEAIYIPKGQLYYSDWTGSPDIRFYSISFDYLGQGTASHYYPLQKFTCSKRLLNTAKEAYALVNSQNEDDKYLAIAKFYEVYPEIKNSLSVARHNTSYLEIMQAVNYIEQNCTADFAVSTLAKMCNMSESKFYAAFKLGTGFSPTEYKNHVRVMRAEQMLAQNSCSIEYICEQLNFCSPAYFRRVFKQHTQMLPSQVKHKTGTI